MVKEMRMSDWWVISLKRDLIVNTLSPEPQNKAQDIEGVLCLQKMWLSVQDQVSQHS